MCMDEILLICIDRSIVDRFDLTANSACILHQSVLCLTHVRGNSFLSHSLHGYPGLLTSSETFLEEIDRADKDLIHEDLSIKGPTGMEPAANH